MATRARIRKQIDFGRLREALAGPRSDTRSWLAMARVDDDPDAVQFIDGFGWVADVTFISGDIAGEGPIPCRVLSFFGEPQQATLPPVALGAEVLVAIPDGDINVQPVIVGYLHNPTDSPIPTTVNGESVNEAYAATTLISKTSSSLNAEFGPTVRASAQTKASLEAPSVALADQNATQPFVRGLDYQSAEQQLVAALNAYALALGPPGPVVPVTTAMTGPAATALGTALLSFLSAVSTSLSTRVRGE
jgi:hypothetical protein